MLTHAVIVAVEEFQALRWREPDLVRAVSECATALRQVAPGLPQNNLILLHGVQATRSSVQKVLDWVLGSATAEDTVLVYFAGHGMNVESECFYLCADSDNLELPTTGLSLSKLRQQTAQSSAGQVVLWVDLYGGMRDPEGDYIPANVAQAKLHEALLATSAKDKLVLVSLSESSETSRHDHANGARPAESVLKAVQGGAINSAGEITAGSLFDYVDAHRPKWASFLTLGGEQSRRIVLGQDGTAGNRLKLSEGEGAIGGELSIVEVVKSYLIDERYRIRLRDLVGEEVDRLCERLSARSGSFDMDAPLTPDAFRQRVDTLESSTERLLNLMITGCFWGKVEQRALWIDALERVMNPSSPRSGLLAWLNLRRYPAVLMLYGGGIAAMANKRYDTVNALLTEPKAFENTGVLPAVFVLYPWAVMEREMAWWLAGLERRRTPVSDRIQNVLREPLRPYLSLDARYQEAFDRFEYLYALCYADTDLIRGGDGFTPAIGAFAWRSQMPGVINVRQAVANEIAREKERWLPIEGGMFGGSVERVERARACVESQLNRLSWY